MRPIILLAVAVLVGCDTISRDAGMMDSGKVVTDSAGGTVGLDTGAAHYGFTGDSTKSRILMDSNAVTLFPEHPTRGSVVVAFLRSDSSASARCAWRGKATPCHVSDSGVRVFVPISADDSAGTYPLTMETPNAKITRQITIEDRDFGRELILLSDSLYALVTRRSEIARDARAVQQVLAAVSPEQRWTGRWRDPAREREKTSPYGVERFYAPSTDSTRTIPLGSEKTTAAFGTDSSRSSNAGLPGWRHAGIDIARFKGSLVTAPAGGVVADVGTYTLMGHTVIIDHGLGVFSAYFHLDTALVRRGDIVRAGQELARVGRTGLATGPHLHYGVYVNGRDVDPVLWREAVEWMAGKGRAVAARDRTR